MTFLFVGMETELNAEKSLHPLPRSVFYHNRWESVKPRTLFFAMKKVDIKIEMSHNDPVTSAKGCFVVLLSTGWKRIKATR